MAETSKRLEVIEAMIQKGSKDPFHHYARGMELRSLGRTEDALRALEDVEKSFPDYVPTYLMAAQIAQELGRIEDAGRLAETGIDRARAAHDDHALSELTTFRSTLK